MATPLLKETNTDGVFIALVVDSSGSMLNKKQEVIDGVNNFFKTQKAIPGSARFSLTFFDSVARSPIVDAKVSSFNELDATNYNPEGWTALNDAVANAIVNAEVRRNGRKVLVVILTDGEENASRSYKSHEVKKLIESKQSQGWDFTFIGAGPNAWAQSTAIGLNRPVDFVNYDSTRIGGTQAAFSSATMSVSNSRQFNDKMHTDYRKEADK